MAAPGRQSLVDRLEAQLSKVSREADHLRKLDASMKVQLRAAIEENERHKKTIASQSDLLADLRRQLAKSATDMELLRAELAAEKASRPPPPPAAAAPPETPTEEKPATRWNRLEIDP